ncbi:hypothetical protein HW555_004588 [Spodoptera exigua]|uniref:Peptidase S1 domain-containing protein n=1 Tax=Spodoptera exigua TaxID=7107 RepID=A0A835GJC8_SPOEX|nr:hypothetical protein HW555_004588 [Spodoptera exigua]
MNSHAQEDCMSQELQLPPPESRTLVGNTTTIKKYPFAVQVGKDMLENAPFKGGGLYVDPADFYIHVGTTRDHEAGGKRYEVSAIIHHENFTYFVNDIALVRTREPVGLGPTVATVSVNNLGTENLYLTSKVKLIGWGSAGSSNSKVLQEVSIQLIGWDLCANIYSKKGITTTNMICGERPTGEGMCAFHLGGPLVLGDILVAIASSFSCQDKKIQDLYTMFI